MLEPFYQDKLIEAGCDEAGRGCLAGPVYAAAVILPLNFYNPLLNDSKKLNEKQRYALREMIQQEAIAWAVGSVDQLEIDEMATRTRTESGDDSTDQMPADRCRNSWLLRGQDTDGNVRPFPFRSN